MRQAVCMIAIAHALMGTIFRRHLCLIEKNVIVVANVLSGAQQQEKQ